MAPMLGARGGRAQLTGRSPYMMPAMTPRDLLAWFDEIAARGKPEQQDGSAAALIMDMESAIAMAFSPAHAVRRSWTEMKERTNRNPRFAGYSLPLTGAWHEIEGVFRSAHGQLKAGRLRSLTDGVRVETVGDCLDAAEQLLGGQHPLAAMVIAGGALEVHLKHLCERHGLTWKGPGSIEKYNGALAEARNEGVETISATDSKAVTSWGGRRNDAAHTPTTFGGTVDEIRLIVEGIRQFLSRTA